MAESADATDLKSVDGDIVRVRPPLAPLYCLVGFQPTLLTELAGVFAEALDELEAGHLTTADLADIMGYAAYRINLGKQRKAG